MLTQRQRRLPFNGNEGRIKRPWCCPARINIGTAAKGQGIGYFIDRMPGLNRNIPFRKIDGIIHLAAIGQLPQGSVKALPPQIAHRVLWLMHAHPETAIRMHTACSHRIHCFHFILKQSESPPQLCACSFATSAVTSNSALYTRSAQNSAVLRPKQLTKKEHPKKAKPRVSKRPALKNNVLKKTLECQFRLRNYPAGCAPPAQPDSTHGCRSWWCSHRYGQGVPAPCGYQPRWRADGWQRSGAGYAASPVC